MRCKFSVSRTLVKALTVASLGMIFIRCNESLPTYKFPDRVLSLQTTLVEQLPDRVAPPGRQVVHVRLTGENVYTDIFQDSVDVKGTVRIWWQDMPTRLRTLYLTVKNFSNRGLVQNGQLTLLPGEQFTMDVYWNLKDDDSIYIPSVDLIYQPFHLCDVNVMCGDPVIFVVEASISIYDRLGFIASPPVEFPFVKRECVGTAEMPLPPCI
ncbi:MAG: hypothetical protein ABSF91_01130 [Bacteroidota bacterium]